MDRASDIVLPGDEHPTRAVHESGDEVDQLLSAAPRRQDLHRFLKVQQESTQLGAQ